jgi:hypothetical protein
MKIKFLATGNAPNFYTFSGEVITVHIEETDSFDLSDFPQDGVFVGIESDLISLPPSQLIRDVERTDDLYVTLCQKPPVTKITYIVDGKPLTLLAEATPPEEHEKKIEHRGGNWKESDWIDSQDYDPETLYIQEV